MENYILRSIEAMYVYTSLWDILCFMCIVIIVFGSQDICKIKNNT